MTIGVRYVELENMNLGVLGLLTWIEPLDRLLLGNSIDTIDTGRFMDVLVYPQHTAWSTAPSPSLPGGALHQPWLVWSDRWDVRLWRIPRPSVEVGLFTWPLPNKVRSLPIRLLHGDKDDRGRDRATIPSIDRSSRDNDVRRRGTAGQGEDARWVIKRPDSS